MHPPPRVILVLAVLVVGTGRSGAAPGDRAGDFAGFGVGGKIQDAGIEYAKAVIVDPQGRVVMVGRTNGQFGVQRLTGARFQVAERQIFPIAGAPSTAQANAVAIAPDGKIVVAGAVFSNGNSDFAVARLNPDLTLDTSFDLDGVTFVDFDGNADDHGYGDEVHALAVQSDGKIVLAGGAVVGGDYRAGVMRLNANGTVDTGFNGNGTQSVARIISFADVAIQDDGKIVLTGTDFDDVLNANFAVVRLKADGTGDPTFDQDGLVITGFGANEEATALALLPDGRIVVAGYRSFDTPRIHVARYLSNGTLDGTFEGDGKLTDPEQAAIYDVLVQPDGKIVVAGSSFASQKGRFFLTRYDTNGTLDLTFGDSGRVVTPFDATTEALSLAGQADGTLVAVGFRLATKSQAARYRWDGSLDAGGLATLIFDPLHGGSEATALALDASSRLVIAGKTYRADYDIALARMDSFSGGLDRTFGLEAGNKGGKIVYGLVGESEEPRAVTTQTDGKIVFAGEVNTPANGQNFLVGRFREDGEHDLECSFIGFTSVHFGTGDDRASAVQLDPGNRIYVAGTVRGPTSDDFGAVRLKTSCQIDQLDSNAIHAGDYQPRRDLGGTESCAGFVRQGGDLVFGGSSGNDIALMRIAPTFAGPLITDTSFGTSGRAILDTGYTETASGIGAQPDGKLVVAGTVNRGGTSDFLVARFSADGHLDTAFGVNGVAFANFNDLDVATSLAIRPGDGAIAVGGWTSTGSGAFFAVAQFTPDGQPDAAFHGDGKATVSFGAAGEDVAEAVTFYRSGDRLVLGGYSVIFGLRQFAIAALETTRDLTVPTTTTSTTTSSTLGPGATTSTTTEASGSTTTTLQPGAREICGNCDDDDGNGLVDFDDPACCPAGTAVMTLARLGIDGGRKGTTLALSGTLAESGVAAGKTATQDVTVEVSVAGRELFCARVPAASLRRKKSRLRFTDKAHAVSSASGIDRLILRARKDGSGALVAGGRKMSLAVPGAGSVRVTLGLRDPASAEDGNRCASAQATLEMTKKGALRLP